jgi:sulfate adenylyltransferase
MSILVAPHGGALVELYAPAGQRPDLRERARTLPAHDLTPRQLCDLELLLSGAMSPLRGFMVQSDYDQVCAEMRLASGVLWPMPITLDLEPAAAEQAQRAGALALRDPEGVVLAVLEVEEAWEPDRELEARQVFGSADQAHPGVRHLLRAAKPVYVGGRLSGLEAPRHYDFRHPAPHPGGTAPHVDKLGWSRVVGFQTRNPMHRAHVELTFRAAQQVEANLLLHPAVGLTKPGDVDHYTRVRCYERVLAHYPEATTRLSLLNLAMRMGGPREALWHALMRKNHGCSHFIIGRDHAGTRRRFQRKTLLRSLRRPGTGAPARGRARHRDRHVRGNGVRTRALRVRAGERGRAGRDGAEPLGHRTQAPAAARARSAGLVHLPGGRRRAAPHPPAARAPGLHRVLHRALRAGKSTLGNALLVALMELGGRPVTLLDGDLVRKHSRASSASRARIADLNVHRIAYVASEITKNGGIAICAPIAPYAEARRAARELVEAQGVFVEVHVATPLEVCELRDRKGLYAWRARARSRSSPESTIRTRRPIRPELRLDTSEMSPEQGLQQLILKLESLGLIRPSH